MNTVADYIRRAADLCGVNPGMKKPFFTVAGAVNAGKSTLTNNLLGLRLCPDDASPSTFFPVYLDFDEKTSAIKTIGGRNIKIEDREIREILRNKKKYSAPEKVQLRVPSEILRWCSMADTPGTGAGEENDGKIIDCLSRADGIIFLFHQRGIDEAAHRFLTALAAAGINGWISFWINANLGLIDGSSLKETSQSVKSIFPGRSEVHVINANERSCVDLVSLFLRVRAMDFFARSIEGRLCRSDKTIPGMIEKTNLQSEDEMFLLKLWEVIEKAQSINADRQAIRELPLIYGNLVNLLRANDSRLTAHPQVAPAPPRTGRALRNPKEDAASLLREIEANPVLIRYDRDGHLKRLREILDEKFSIMVAGPFSTGKTTFLNALLGETLLPAEDSATTSCPVTIRYGYEKTAEVERVSSAEFFPAIHRDGKYTLDHQEILALTQMMETPSLRGQISGSEICRNGIYRSATLSELAGILDEMCLIYNKNPPHKTGREKTLHIPMFSRKIPEKSLPRPAVTGVRLYLDRRGLLPFRLENDHQRLEFYRAISPPGSFLVHNVTISYPSENVSFADFIDTPGLDSLHKRHYERATAALSSGNMALFFLHARHVLSEGIPKHINLLHELGLKMPVFYVINFADILTDLEREKVSIHIRQRLGNTAGHGGIIPYPQVYAISALNALRKGDDGFERLIRRVRKKSGEIKAGKLALAFQDLAEWTGSLSAGEGEGLQNIPERTRQAAHYYHGEIKKMGKRFLGSGVN